MNAFIQSSKNLAPVLLALLLSVQSCGDSSFHETAAVKGKQERNANATPSDQTIITTDENDLSEKKGGNDNSSGNDGSDNGSNSGANAGDQPSPEVMGISTESNPPGGDGSDGNGNGSLADNSPDPDKDKDKDPMPEDPEKEVLDLCTASTHLKLVQPAKFEEKTNCNFASAKDANDAATPGNLERLNGHLMARESTEKAINLPDGAVICSLSLKSQQNDFRYDDFLVISLNKYALVISNDYLMGCDPANPDKCLQKDEKDLWTWDFDRIKGRPFDFEGKPWCFGSDSPEDVRCTFPGHDKSGAVDFYLGTKAVVKLSAKLKDEKNLGLSVTATGDNDDGDCEHKELNLDLDIGYVMKP